MFLKLNSLFRLLKGVRNAINYFFFCMCKHVLTIESSESPPTQPEKGGFDCLGIKSQWDCAIPDSQFDSQAFAYKAISFSYGHRLRLCRRSTVIGSLLRQFTRASVLRKRGVEWKAHTCPSCLRLLSCPVAMDSAKRGQLAPRQPNPWPKS